jgi:biotin carboxyl carrier protein
MRLRFEHSGQTHELDLTPAGKSYRIQMGERAARVEIVRAEKGRLDLLVDGLPVSAYFSADKARRWVTVNGQTFVLTQSSRARRSGHGHHNADELTAPMPGQVRGVNVAEGQAVTKGQTLLLLEAMKMEIRIQATGDGVVKRLAVQQDETVERGQILIEIGES